jgi:fatty acid desaturase
MYRIVLGLIIIIFTMRLIWISRSEGWDIAWWSKTLNQRLSQIYRRLMMSDSKGEFHKRLRYFFISVSLLSFIILAFTGILPVLVLDVHITGILLIIHVTVAPVFVVALAMTALFWGHFQQFDGTDLDLIKAVQNQEKDKRPEYRHRAYWPKVFFWLFLAFSIPASLSMIFSMFPYFGTDGLNTMLNIHQYTTLGLLTVAFFYTDFKLLSSDKKSN